jgi:hypothetical protein
VSSRVTPTLADLGITRDQASKWMRLAAIPEVVCEEALSSIRPASIHVSAGNREPHGQAFDYSFEILDLTARIKAPRVPLPGASAQRLTAEGGCSARIVPLSGARRSQSPRSLHHQGPVRQLALLFLAVTILSAAGRSPFASTPKPRLRKHPIISNDGHGRESESPRDGATLSA